MLVSRDEREGGFTLIEVMITAAVAVAILAAVTTAIQACNTASAQLERKLRATEVASALMERLFLIPYGSAGAAAATADERAELFDDDAQFGTASLHSLRTPLGDPGEVLTVPADPYHGVWRLRVTEDLDDDGVADGEDELAEDLLRIDLSLDGVTLLEAVRGAPAD